MEQKSFRLLVVTVAVIVAIFVMVSLNAPKKGSGEAQPAPNGQPANPNGVVEAAASFEETLSESDLGLAELEALVADMDSETVGSELSSIDSELAA